VGHEPPGVVRRRSASNFARLAANVLRK